MAGFLDLRRLRYFLAIGEERSISAAARLLNVAQPALSYHVAELERRLGAPLLERRHDGVKLTELGSALHRHAVEIDARVRQAERELTVQARTESETTRVRLAVISSIAADLTPTLLTAVARDLTGVALRITESGTLDSRELLERGRADLAIHLGPAAGQVLLAHEQLLLVSRYDESVTGTVSLAQVADYPLILPARGNPLRDFIEGAAAKLGHRLRIVLEIDGPGSRRNAVLAGHGHTIFGALYFGTTDRIAGLSEQPINDPPLVRPLYFGVRRGFDPLLAERVRSVLGQALRGLALEAQESEHTRQK